jgi:hypothetical protein
LFFCLFVVDARSINIKIINPRDLFLFTFFLFSNPCFNPSFDRQLLLYYRTE